MTDWTGIDDRSRANIETLLEKVQDLAIPFLRRINEALAPSGCHAKVICGNRTYSEQDDIYAQGRTRPGPIVTNARGGYSYHNFGLAFDIGIFDRNGRYIDDLPNERNSGWTQRMVDQKYELGGPISRSLSLEWGGYWTRLPDAPHYQFNPRGLTLAQMREWTEKGRDLI